MKLWKQLKHKLLTAVTAAALGVVALSGAKADAATIVNEPQENYKYLKEVGDSDSTGGYVANFRINGKKYSKMKKKVKTVQTAYDPRYWTNRGTKINYTNSEFNPDTVDTSNANDNDKTIAAGEYTYTFLKAGTYTISYDRYSTSSKETTSPDGTYTTTEYELKKTHYVKTYKVLATSSAVKSITLGKNKITYSCKYGDGKGSTKTVVKNRFLKGSSGKLSIKTTSKNFKVTSAYVVTYDATGRIVVSPSGNNQKITYGTGKKAVNRQVKEYDRDAQGNRIPIKDASGKITGYQTHMRTYATETDKYKTTTVYYGLQNAFTGSYTQYAVEPRTVYVVRKDANGDPVYKKDDKGNDTYEYEYDPVTATAIVTKYPEKTIADGAYKVVECVVENIILPDAVSLSSDDDLEYYLSAKGDYRRYSGSTYEVSKDGVAPYVYATLTDGSLQRYGNPVYNRKFYEPSYGYQGSWQPATEDDCDSRSRYSDFTIDPVTGYRTYTAHYKWVTAPADANGDIPKIEDHDNTYVGSYDGSWKFEAK